MFLTGTEAVRVLCPPHTSQLFNLNSRISSRWRKNQVGWHTVSTLWASCYTVSVGLYLRYRRICRHLETSIYTVYNMHECLTDMWRCFSVRLTQCHVPCTKICYLEPHAATRFPTDINSLRLHIMHLWRLLKGSTSPHAYHCTVFLIIMHTESMRQNLPDGR